MKMATEQKSLTMSVLSTCIFKLKKQKSCRGSKIGILIIIIIIIKLTDLMKLLRTCTCIMIVLLGSKVWSLVITSY